jgi:hypothetical protein
MDMAYVKRMKAGNIRKALFKSGEEKDLTNRVGKIFLLVL